VQLAVLDDDQDQLIWLEQVWEEIHQKYMYPTGSLSVGEQLVTPTDEPNGHHQETCAPVEWLPFCHRLYLATGNQKEKG
jgi:DUF1680 family protein